MSKPTVRLGILFAGLCIVSFGLCADGLAQGEMAGLYILDGRGPVYEQGIPPKFAGDPFLGVDIARDMELVTGPDNKVTGYFILDGFGNMFEVGAASLQGATPPGFGMDIARDLELLRPGMFPTSPGTPADAIGFYVLDGMGGIHPVGSATTLPGSVNGLFDDDPAVDGLGPFFGFDIARDLELSVNVDGPTQGQVNGYYLLDGFGRVFAMGGAQKELLRSIPGMDISTPYFGWDIARAIEITPSGNGIYLLDGYGGVHRMGDAFEPFPLGGPEQSVHWGWDIARDIELITDGAKGVLGYYVLAGDGTLSGAGIAEQAPYPGPWLGMDIANDLETTFWMANETFPSPSK